MRQQILLPNSRKNTYIPLYDIAVPFEFKFKKLKYKKHRKLMIVNLAGITTILHEE